VCLDVDGQLSGGVLKGCLQPVDTVALNVMHQSKHAPCWSDGISQADARGALWQQCACSWLPRPQHADADDCWRTGWHFAVDCSVSANRSLKYT